MFKRLLCKINLRIVPFMLDINYFECWGFTLLGFAFVAPNGTEYERSLLGLQFDTDIKILYLDFLYFTWNINYGKSLDE